jgi:hypothetical protein
LDESILERTLNTSSSVGMEIRAMFSSSVMIGGKRSASSSSIGGEEEENRLEKWSTKILPIAVLSESQPPALVFKKFTAFDLLLMMVDVWKNFVLRSEQVSQVSLDFDFQRVSSCRRSSSRASLRFFSVVIELGHEGAC